MRTFPIFLFSAALALVAFDTGCDDDPPRLQSDAGPTSGPPQLRRDVIPLFRTWCATSACHGIPENDLGLLLQTSNPDLVHQELLSDSRMAVATKVVVPGNPDASFLMAKIDGTQASFSKSCPTNPQCGSVMPPDGKLSDELRKTVRDWIAAGAKND